MRGECVALRGKLLQVRFVTQNTGETLVSRLVRTLRVLSLPPFKFGSALIPCGFPDVGSRDSLSRLFENLVYVRINRSAPIRGGVRTRGCLGRHGLANRFLNGLGLLVVHAHGL